MVFASLLIGLIIFLYSFGAAVKFCVEKSTPKKMLKIVDGIVRGAHPSFSNSQSPLPTAISVSMRRIQKSLRSTGQANESLFWDLGSSIAEASHQIGYDDGVAVGANPADVIRIEMPLNELLHLSWLAHLGFQHMMPNYRGIEVHRFSGADEAREGARSVGILECAIPRDQRPFADLKSQLLSRENMISDWWIDRTALKSA